MPLYKRKPFSPLDRPDDLKPEELVFQVRFTKEIFRDYGEYLKRINLYRQRVWTCKVTGKVNMTYEEALVSERKATEKVQQFPKDLVVPVLRDVQFSMLTLKDLVNTIASNLQERLLEGTELYGRKNNRIYPCKIVKVLDEEVDKTQYRVAWLDKDNKVTENAVVTGDDLIRKKLPFTKDVLKSFIRESTCRGVPWVLHDTLARKHGISTVPPEELRSKFFGGASNRKRKLTDKDRRATLVANNGEGGEYKRKKLGEEDFEAMEPIKYPIDDLLVKPAADDPIFTPRPPPCRDFNVPMECVGDLLMVWDFCCSFSRLLNLSPFSLEDFENAICHKDSNIVLIVESQSALLRLLIKDKGDYFMAIEKKKRKSKITLVTWRDYLCDFLELASTTKLSAHITTVRRGHYGLLDIHAKLGIFGELITQVLASDIVREKLDESIEERQALAATKRGEALEEGRKRRENKELAIMESESKEVLEGRNADAVRSNSSNDSYHSQNGQNGNASDKHNGKIRLAQGKQKIENSESKQVNKRLYKDAKKQKVDTTESMKLSTGKGGQKLKNIDKTEVAEKKSIKQRKEYLEREIEKRFICTNPLGKDRDYNRYWFFRRESRIFVESSDSGQWGYYSTKDEVDSLMGSLNRKGERERALKKQLEKHYDKICSQMQKRSKEVAHRTEMEEAAVRRSTRVRAPPRENPALAFLKYVNKLKED